MRKKINLNHEFLNIKELNYGVFDFEIKIGRKNKFLKVTKDNSSCLLCLHDKNTVDGIHEFNPFYIRVKNDIILDIEFFKKFENIAYCQNIVKRWETKLYF